VTVTFAASSWLMPRRRSATAAIADRSAAAHAGALGGRAGLELGHLAGSSIHGTVSVATAEPPIDGGRVPRTVAQAVNASNTTARIAIVRPIAGRSRVMPHRRR